MEFQACLIIVLFSSAEDPSENYVKLRDYVLVKLCQPLPSFSTDKLPMGFSDDMSTEAREKFKINKVNCNFIHRAQRRICLITALSEDNKAFSFFTFTKPLMDKFSH